MLPQVSYEVRHSNLYVCYTNSHCQLASKARVYVELKQPEFEHGKSQNAATQCETHSVARQHQKQSRQSAFLLWKTLICRQRLFGLLGCCRIFQMCPLRSLVFQLHISCSSDRYGAQSQMCLRKKQAGKHIRRDRKHRGRPSRAC